MNKNFWATMGHTYEDHVAIDMDSLKERLLLGKYDTGSYDGNAVSVASKFTSEKVAEKAITAALEHKKPVIDEWMKFQYSTRLTLHVTFSRQIGEAVAKNTNWNTIYPMYSLVIVLQADCHFRSYEVVTAYPVPNESVRNKILLDRKTWLSNKRRHI